MKFLSRLSARKKMVALCYGQGGHETQMSRLVDSFIAPSCYFLAITDSENKHTWYKEKVKVKEIRDKKEVRVFKMLLNTAYNFIGITKAMFKYNVMCCISTGPGVCVLTCAICKLGGAKIVHIETWSRFYKKSLTGRIMYYLSDVFYVQNQECMLMYPKAIYCGRL